jgi:hypothetical protein
LNKLNKRSELKLQYYNNLKNRINTQKKNNDCIIAYSIINNKKYKYNNDCKVYLNDLRMCKILLFLRKRKIIFKNINEKRIYHRIN